MEKDKTQKKISKAVTNNKNKDEFQLIKTANDHKIAVYQYDPPNLTGKCTERMFFIHGVAGCTQVWREQIKYFKDKGWSCIGIDFIGHGRSEKNYSSNEFEFIKLAEDALFVFDKFRVKRNVLVAHSYGCSVATYVANERMDKIDKMVLISGGGPEPLGEVESVFNCCNCFLFCFHCQIIRVFKKKSFSSSLSQQVWKENKDKAVNVNAHVLKSMMRGQIWKEGNETMHEKLNIPVLLLRGTMDVLICQEDEDEMLSVLPIAKFVPINEAGHMAMLENPDVVSEEIWKFMNSDFSNQITRLQKRLKQYPTNTNNQTTTVQRRKSSIFFTQRKKHHPPSYFNGKKGYDNKTFGEKESQRPQTLPPATTITHSLSFRSRIFPTTNIQERKHSSTHQ